MVNYNNGKVYMIEPVVEMIDEGDIYIGSTTKERLSQRMDTHRSNYKIWKDGRRRKLTSFDLFDKYGVKNCKITLLEVCCCNSKDELKSRESHFIKTVKCVNKCIPNRTKAEWEAENKEHMREYNLNYKAINREKILERKQKMIVCSCGKTILNDRKATHLRSAEHLQYEAVNVVA
jgi:hypothetical protein